MPELHLNHYQIRNTIIKHISVGVIRSELHISLSPFKIGVQMGGGRRYSF